MYSRPTSRLGDARPMFRRTWPVPLLFVLLATAFLLAGGDLLRRHFLAEHDRAYRAFGGWALVTLALLQFRLTLSVWLCRETIDTRRFGWRSAYWRWALIGPVVCYLLMLGLDGERHARYLFRVALALWYTGMLLAVVRPTVFSGRAWAWARRPLPRRLGHAFFAAAMLCVVAELALRIDARLRGDRVEVSYVAAQCVLSPGSEFRGRRVNQLGFWDEEFQPRSADAFRLAVLGDELALSGSAQSNFLARLERRFPFLEVYNFGVARTGPREYAATLARQVLRYEPDLVLALISIGDDVTGRLRLPGNFDWRSLHLCQFLHRTFSAATFNAPPPRLHVPRDREAYLQAAALRLTVCRSPLDERMQRRWRETFAYLDDLTATCRRHELPVVLAVAPSEVQMDGRLRRTLCRRVGCPLEDVQQYDLPQRKLAEYARDRQVPLVDLLPHFRLANDPLYDRNDHLWNPHANQLAARVIGDWLDRRLSPQIAAGKTAWRWRR